MPWKFVLGGLPFKGPVSLDLLPPLEGVYLVLAVDPETLKVVEVGDASNLRVHLVERSEKDSWARHRDFGEIMFAFYFVAGAEPAERKELSRMVRRALDPAGGVNTPYLSRTGDHFWKVNDDRTWSVSQKK